MFKRCLICTNFNDRVDRFIHFVPELANAGFETIIFYHSVDIAKEGEIPHQDSPQIKEAQALLAPALQSVPDGVEVSIEVTFGNPLQSIPRLVKTNNIDLIIVATPAVNSLQEKIFGSTTEAIASTISIPLLIFRPQLLALFTHEEMALRCRHLLRNVLVAYSDDDSGNYLIENIQNLLKQQSQSFVETFLLTTVVDEHHREPLITQQLKEQAENKLASIKNEFEKHSVKVETQVATGVPVLEIVKIAYEEEVSAIAIGQVNMARIMQIISPSLAQEFLNRSWFPILFFSPKA